MQVADDKAGKKSGREATVLDINNGKVAEEDREREGAAVVRYYAGRGE
jgi:hypothetical protein